MRSSPTVMRRGLGLLRAAERRGEVDPAAVVNGVHTAEFVTPTGARYRPTAPPLPGAPLIAVSEVEVRIGVALADLHAA